jgi:hypothetical protein
MNRCRLASLLLVLLLGLPPRAGLAKQPGAARTSDQEAAEQAQDRRGAARALFEEGRQLFQGGLYQDALARFERANRLVPSFVLDYNVARCREGLGLLREAIRGFERVAAHAADQALVQRARAKIRELRDLQAHTGVALEGSGLGWRVTVDGEAVPADATNFVTVEPGVHQLRIWDARDAMFEAPVTLRAGDVVALTPRFGPPASAYLAQGREARLIHERHVPTWLERHWVSLAGFTLATAGLGVGVGYHAAAQAKWDRIAGARRDEDGVVVGMTEQRAAYLAGRADDFRTVSLVGYGVFGVALAGTVVAAILERGLAGDQPPGMVMLPGGPDGPAAAAGPW